MTHWKKLTNPNYLGSYAFEEGEEKVVTITKAGIESVMSETGKEECIVVHFDSEKPLIANKTNCKAITKLLGTPYIEEWPGKSIILTCQKVKAFGEMVDAVRVSSKLPHVCSDCGNLIKAGAGKSAKELSDISTQTYGRKLCFGCMVIEKNKKEVENNG